KTHKSIPRFHLRNPRYRRGRSRRAPPSRLPPPSSHAAARRLRRSSSPFVPSILLRLSSTEAPPHHEGNFTVRTLGSMSYFQATTYKPHNGIIVDKVAIGLGSTCKLLHERAKCSYSNRFIKLQEQVYPRLLLVAACHNRIGPVYASSGKGNSERVNDPFSMESLNKAIAGTKKQWPIQDMLIDQISKIRGSGSGGNGGGNKNSHEGSGGGSEDESLTESLYEMVQVLLATIAFILMYIHIIRGEELYRLARDYTRYLVTGKRTSRLKRAMLNWHNFCEGITNKDSVQESTFERSTSEPMWWQQPLKFVHRIEELYRGYFRPHAQES
ncbi:Os04g0493300, partial [Oryza sativa Japonica Group]